MKEYSTNMEYLNIDDLIVTMIGSYGIDNSIFLNNSNISFDNVQLKMKEGKTELTGTLSNIFSSANGLSPMHTNKLLGAYYDTEFKFAMDLNFEFQNSKFNMWNAQIINGQMNSYRGHLIMITQDDFSNKNKSEIIAQIYRKYSEIDYKYMHINQNDDILFAEYLSRGDTIIANPFTRVVSRLPNISSFGIKNPFDEIKFEDKKSLRFRNRFEIPVSYDIERDRLLLIAIDTSLRYKNMSDLSYIKVIQNENYSGYKLKYTGNIKDLSYDERNVIDKYKEICAHSLIGDK